ncbi:hypothetical protein Taro_042974 [Colocasia esculenta]|uniref:Uncharacterized protein n=1 Tax=Colocasia esculenta TaxID=4460 RepID=A0A843X0K7_COLES|nr:hypothetical protein [Colocasia esculenta]
MAARPPLDHLLGEFFERGVKALDVCNAVRDGIEQVRQWRKHMEIVLVALDPAQRAVGEGQLRRARKALTDLTIAMLDEKKAGSTIAQRNRSFGPNNTARDHHHRSLGRHFQSLSWSVSRSWSAARQLQAIGSNLTASRSNEIIATNEIAIHVYTMNIVLLFVMWALVAAIPCQDPLLGAQEPIVGGAPNVTAREDIEGIQEEGALEFQRAVDGDLRHGEVLPSFGGADGSQPVSVGGGQRGRVETVGAGVVPDLRFSQIFK